MRGVSLAQDARYTDKTKKHIKEMDFPPELDKPVRMKHTRVLIISLTPY